MQWNFNSVNCSSKCLHILIYKVNKVTIQVISVVLLYNKQENRLYSFSNYIITIFYLNKLHNNL